MVARATKQILKIHVENSSRSPQRLIHNFFFFALFFVSCFIVVIKLSTNYKAQTTRTKNKKQKENQLIISCLSNACLLQGCLFQRFHVEAERVYSYV
jgi:Sec-independent protein secretion pathway component TatC